MLASPRYAGGGDGVSRGRSGMKITKVHIENFKRFVPPGLDISLRRAGDQGRVSEQFLLLGDNGTGKTTVLQAIALTLSLAAKQTRTVNDLRWVGWAGDRYYAKGDPIVEVSVEFSPEEIEATHRINRRWWDTFGKSTGGYTEPGKDEKITLRLRGPTVEVAGGEQRGAPTVPGTNKRGRSYESRRQRGARSISEIAWPVLVRSVQKCIHDRRVQGLRTSLGRRRPFSSDSAA